VNRLLVERKTIAEAFASVSYKSVSRFFLTTFPSNMLKFPVFEVINAMLVFAPLSHSARGIVTGWLFCTLMLPVTNYRFLASMGWQATPGAFYQAYVPTACRDIVYGWARSTVGASLQCKFEPDTAVSKALVFGMTVWISCLVSSPGNEWRGYALQQKGRELPFREYFQPTSFLRSSGVGSTIMGVALAIGMLVTSGVETLLLFVRANLLIVLGLLVFVAAVTLFRRLARTRSSKGA